MSQDAAKTSLTNELAKERNREAADRTLMAWIRTSIALIGFGFAIAKSYEYIETEYLKETGKALDATHTPIIFGAAFIILGILGIIAGVIQYGRVLDRIKSDRFTYMEPWPLPKIMALLLLLIGGFGFFAIFI